MFEFKLPDLGEGIHEGELLKWHVKPGDPIREDDPLVDVETDKAAVTIPSPRAGTLVSVAGSPGDTVKVGQVLAVIDESAGAVAVPVPAPSAQPAPVIPIPPPIAPPPPPVPPSAPAVKREGPIPAAPAVRRLARELGVDLALVPGSGPAGRVSAEDVQRFAKGGVPPSSVSVMTEETPEDTAAPPAAGGAGPIPYLDLEPLPDFSQFGPVEKEPVRSIRRKTARKMVTSMVLVPHVAHMDDADVTDLEAFRQRERTKRAGQPGGKLSLLPFVIQAVTAALKKYPMFNASLDPFREEIIYKKYYNIGIAVDSGKGLMVPVIKDTTHKSILEVAAEIESLALKARGNAIDVGDLRGGTFTITNVGPLGGKGLIPTINYPEVAILGMGRAEARAVVREGQIVVRTILPLTLAFDHRIADGADAARFMNDVIRRLSDPLTWLLEG